MGNPLFITSLSLALLMGVGIGYSLTPEYAQMRSDKATPMMEVGNADRNVDLRYLDGMIAHHLSAIDMARQGLSESERDDVRSLAETIIRVDEEGIAQLYAWKKEWYGNTRQVTQFAKTNLGKADERFDLRFINGLIAHHKEAIAVARDMQTKSTRNEVLTLTDEVIRSLSAGITTLEGWRKAWYGIE